MSFKLFGASAIAMLAATAAQADTVLNTSLQNINASSANGNATAMTTTDASGTRTSVTGAASTPNASANRVSGTYTPGTFYQSEVGIGSTVGITTDFARSGNGSAYFSGGDDRGKADLVYGFTGGLVPLASITSMSYDFYRAGVSNVDAHLSPVMRLIMYKGSQFAGSLVLEGVYQNQTPGNPLPAVTEDSWQTASATLTSGKFWATSALLGPTFADANGGVKTLDEWIAANAGSTLSVAGISVGFGSGWNNVFVGAVDNVAISFAGGPSVNANFEVAAAGGAVPEPATWAMLMLGFGAVGFAARRRRTLAAA